MTSGRKKLASQALLLGHDYAYTYDDIGNRKTATANGQTSTYTPNTLNQYTQRTVPGTVDVFGRAAAEATVTVTSPAIGGTISPTTRQGEAFSQQLTVANTATAQFPSLEITAVKNNAGPAGEDVVSEVTKTAFVAKTPEAFGYDADGNLTSDGRWTYTWDAESRLIACETNPLAAAAGVPRQKLEFAYDAFGRRVQKKVSTWSGSAYVLTSELSFVYDGWNLLLERDALNAHALVRSYTWGLDLGGSLQGAGGVGGLLFVATAGNTYATTYDGNGNVTGLVNTADGTLAADYEYDPFGNVIKAVGSAANATPFGFSSKYTDQETSLLYYGFRYYNPQTGRWPSRDPIEERGGVNLYGMVGNDTVNDVDVLGLIGGASGNQRFTPEQIEGARRRAFDMIRSQGNVAEGLPQNLLKQWLWKLGNYTLSDGEFDKHAWGPQKYRVPKVLGMSRQANPFESYGFQEFCRRSEI